ncbi:MAG: hypothetical protein Q8P52_02965 [bacterium]|nr:hypothetical protein [bacterium]
MNDDLKWFFGLLAVFALLWFVGSGPNSPSSRDAFVKPPQNIGDNIETFSNSGNERISSPDSLKEGEQQVIDWEDMQTKSPIAGKVYIYRINRNAKTAESEYVLIRADRNNTKNVSISDFSLQSPATGRSVKIGLAHKLPFYVQGKAVDPIVLRPGGMAYIYTGISPNGLSFEISACTGYFEQNNDFSPRLKTECPDLLEEELPSYPNALNDACLNYLENISSCTVPSNLPLGLSGDCKAYISEKVNYTNCVASHRNEPDFFKNEWRIYLGRSDRLWKNSRETIELYDGNGKIVDSISY